MEKQAGRTQLNTARMTKIALMTAIICVISPWVIMLPFSPVPVSFALFAVLLCGYLLGARDGSICCVLYLILGGIGLPFFSGGAGGLGKLFGPTGGYLFGYIIAVAVTGLLAQKWKKKRLFHVVGMVLGVCGCYAVGTVWLSISMDVGITEGLMIGVLPYIPADLIKIIITCLLGYELRDRMRKGL